MRANGVLNFPGPEERWDADPRERPKRSRSTASPLTRRRPYPPALLQTEHAPARGVACAERLVRHATSPLYGGDAAALRRELCRVHALLRDRRD